MKSLISAIIIFATLIILIISNSVYVHISCDRMISMTSTLTVEDQSGAIELCELWQKHKPIYSISIHDSHIDKITEATESIKSAVARGNGAEFDKSVTLLTELLDELKNNERLSLQGIL